MQSVHVPLLRAALGVLAGSIPAVQLAIGPLCVQVFGLPLVVFLPVPCVSVSRRPGAIGLLRAGSAAAVAVGPVLLFPVSPVGVVLLLIPVG